MAQITEHQTGPGRRGRWLLVAVLGVLVAGLLVELGRAAAQDDISPAPSAGPVADESSVVAVAGQVTRDGYGLYLLDLRNQTITVYQYVPNSRVLRLLAARTFAFDVQLDEFNTEPSPREIRDLVESTRRLTDPAEIVDEPTTQPAEPAEPVEP